MIKYSVPFYANTFDDLHCFQAAMKMAMKYFWPEREFSWEELDRITAFQKGEWTWPMTGLLWLAGQGVEIKDIEVFDYQRFIQEGGQYLIEEFGEEVGRAQIVKSDIAKEQSRAQDFVRCVTIEQRIPLIEDVRGLLEEGYLLIVNVNARVFTQQEGYTGHFAVVIGIDEEGILLHDPGLPAHPDAHIDFATFERAWAYPNERAKNILALRLKPTES